MPIIASPQVCRTLLLALVTLLAYSLWAGGAGRAQMLDKRQAGTVKLSIHISVTDRDSGQPVSGARISIRRRGNNPSAQVLKDLILTTDQSGEATKKDSDFRLSGTPHKLSVAGDNFKPLELDLPDVVLREAALFEGQLTLALSLTRLDGLSAQPSPTAGLPGRDGGILQDLSRRAPEWLTVPVILLIVLAILCSVSGIWWLRRIRMYSFRSGEFVRKNSSPNTSSSSSARELMKAKEASAQPKIIIGDADGRSALKEIKDRLLVIEQKIELTHKMVEDVSRSLRDSMLSRSSSHRMATAEKGTTREPSGGNAQPVEAALPRPAGKDKYLRSFGSLVGRAHQSYLKLVRRETPDHEPLYVEVPTKTTLFGHLTNPTVYLAQATHRQSAFVLFTEDDKLGWVFPNPVLSYRKAALRDVFPDLTKEEFDKAKEKIEPVPVVRVDESRWKVS